ncbi:MAG: hypothetical protein IH957_00590 [Chloroflexi bacterium]|nr:hypothetical protein [Chloroflexota bacterium]
MTSDVIDEDVIEPSREGISYRPLRPPRDTVWSRYWADNFLRSTFTPGGYAYVIWWCEALEHAVDEAKGYRDLLALPMFKYHRGRAYMNTEYLRRRAQYDPPFLRDQELLNHFPPSQRDEVASLPFKLWSRLLGELRVLLFHRDQSLFRNHRFFQRTSQDILARVRSKLDGIDLDHGSLNDLLWYRQLLRQLVIRHEVGYVGWIFHYNTLLDALRATLLRNWYPDGHKETFARLVSGNPDNVSVQIASALWELSRLINSEAALASIFEQHDPQQITEIVGEMPEAERFRKALERFLSKYGDRRESQELYRAPSWVEDPTPVLAILKAMCSLPPERSPDLELETQIRRRGDATEEVESALKTQRFGWLKSRIFRALLRYNLAYSACRENQRFVADTLISRYRRMLLSAGDYLMGSGVLSDREDVFFLTEPEVFDILDDDSLISEGQAKVGSRKTAFRGYQSLPPLFVGGTSQEPEVSVGHIAEDSGPLVLRGTPASHGIATGPARVLKRLSDVDTLRQGDVLVASAIDPGWTVAFPIISAVVTEIGGALSHGAIMAREFGVPAVIGVEGALAQLRNGQTITVDGQSGEVTVAR